MMNYVVPFLGKAMAALSRPLNALKDGYLKAVDWIELHPHGTLWLALGALGVAAWF